MSVNALRVVVLLDGSSFAEGVLEPLIQLGQLVDSQLILLPTVHDLDADAAAASSYLAVWPLEHCRVRPFRSQSDAGCDCPRSSSSRRCTRRIGRSAR